MSIEVVMETQGLLLPVFYLKSVIKDYLTTENSVEKNSFTAGIIL